MNILLALFFILEVLSHPIPADGTRLYYDDRVSSFPDTPHWYMDCEPLVNGNYNCNFYQWQLSGFEYKWILEDSREAQQEILPKCTAGTDVIPAVCWSSVFQVWVISSRLDFVKYEYIQLLFMPLVRGDE